MRRAVEGLQWLGVGMQHFAVPTREATGAQDRVGLVDLIGFDDRREADDFLFLLREDVADGPGDRISVFGL
jgi:hypothetical protein